MQRTQIYLTDEQRRRLDQRASDAGVPMAVVVRDILDEALAIGDTEQARAAAADEAFGALADDETWQEFLGRVRRSGGADDRLHDLGLA
jgi:predicted DNA-binding protein